MNEVLESLGGKFFSKEEYCSTPSGDHNVCIHSMDCAIRSLWTGLSNSMTGYLERCKLSDLVMSEPEMEKWLSRADGAKAGIGRGTRKHKTLKRKTERS